MAPTAQAPVKRATYDGSRPRFQSLEAWLNVYGNAEYAIYKRDAAPKPLSYEDWSKSEHVLGPFLWYTTLDVWEEDSSSEGESGVEAPAFTARVPPKQQPKKASMTNGHGKRGAAKSSPSVAQSISEDAAAAAKRKRKPKKPYLSEDIVVSDVSDEVEESSPAVEAPAFIATVSTSPSNGRRKSGGRRKKQYLSAEIISPDDEEDNPMAMNGIVATASTANEPSAPEQPVSVPAATSQTPKRKSGRKPKKKSLSQAVISKDEDELGDTPADATTTPENAAASPDGPGSSSRRGLRTRTPAQQRPYFHNAQVFDELVSDEPEEKNDTTPSPPRPKQKLRLTGLAQVSFPEFQEHKQEEEDVTILENNNDDDGIMLDSGEPRPSRKAHYKGKGRAWKKTSDDEDQDYRSPVKAKSIQPTRKLGRRRSTQTTENPVEESESEEPAKQQEEDEHNYRQVELVVQSSASKDGKKPRKPRKVSHLSDEFVKDDSDTAPEVHRMPETKVSSEKTQSISSGSPAQKTPKKRGRPRKSDQASAPKPKKEKTTMSEHKPLTSEDSQEKEPSESAQSFKKKLTATDNLALTEADGEKSVETRDQGKGRPKKSATPVKMDVADHVDLAGESTPRKETSEKPVEAISLPGSDGSEPEVIPEENLHRRTERALASDLQALDDSGKAITLPVPPSLEVPKPAALEITKRGSPPPESL